VQQCVALPVPTMAGRPSSRLTMAAWLVRPPWSVTMAAARFMIGTQSGSVLPVTRIAPSTKRSMSRALDQADPAGDDRVADAQARQQQSARARRRCRT
jgi:hypothetical protein